MNTLHSLVPSWLHRKDEDMPDEMAPVPPVAKLERPRDLPEFSEADQDKMIFGRAAVMLEQLKRDREDALKREDELKVQLAESVLARQGDANKIEFLELENAELRNNAATLQADLNNFHTFLSNARRTIDMLNKILDSFGIKAPEKKRKAKKSSVTIEAVKTEGTSPEGS